MIGQTMFFGVVSVGPLDILYPVHSKTDLDRARTQAAKHTFYEADDLRVVVYFEHGLSPARCDLICKQAFQAAIGREHGIEVPRYSEKGPQE